MADIPYGRDYPDPIWCDEDGQPMPPVGAELLDDIRAFLRRFVVYPSDHELIAHTLWIAHCWFMEAWDSTPRIAFLSPEPGSGKSRALEVTEPLVPRPVHAINCTPAYLFRRVADPVGRPTVLYDECDTLFGPKAKEHEEIRGVINAGHRKGAVAGRCVIRGKIVETEELPAYCAVALAGLDDLPDTIMSRSIVVRMRRRAPTEPVEPWRPRVSEITPDHLLLGVLTDPAALATALLQQQEIDIATLRTAVTLPPAVTEPPQPIPFSGPARKVLELTFREALRLGHNYIGTEHLLLALLELEDGDGPLHRSGVDKSRAEADLITTLASLTGANAAGATDAGATDAG